MYGQCLEQHLTHRFSTAPKSQVSEDFTSTERGLEVFCDSSTFERCTTALKNASQTGSCGCGGSPQVSLDISGSIKTVVVYLHRGMALRLVCSFSLLHDTFHSKTLLWFMTNTTTHRPPHLPSPHCRTPPMIESKGCGCHLNSSHVVWCEPRGKWVWRLVCPSLALSDP